MDMNPLININGVWYHSDGETPATDEEVTEYYAIINEPTA